MLFVELYAGMASVNLHLLGHKPPVSRIGSKAGYAAAIVERAGLSAVQFNRFLLVDADYAVAATLRALVDPAKRAAAAQQLGRWAEDRSTWERLRGCDTRDSHTDAYTAARWLFVTAGSRGGVGGFKGAHKLRPSVQGFIPTIPSLIKRLEAMTLPPPGVRIDVLHGLAGSIRPRSDAVVYLDPPYQGRQAYGAVVADDTIETIYKRWRAGPRTRVLVSEGCRLKLPGARVVDITRERRGQARLSLTRSTKEFLHIGP